MAASAGKYQLSKVLTGHTQDVKAVCAPTDSLVLTVSRDLTLRSWSLPSTSESSSATETIYQGHTKFVNCVQFITGTSDNPQGLYISGGSDKVINVFSPSQPQKPTFFLTGHEDNVCTLDVLSDGRIVSGSWDKTARVWCDWKQQFVLKGHSHAVWAVKALHGKDIIVTGSADKTICLWSSKDGSLIKTIQAHSDCVRGLDEVPGIGFVSCGNDSVVKVWSYEGDLIQELFGHTAFVYSVACVQGQSNRFISSGEDRCVRVWEDGSCIQTINLPAISIWSVTSLPNGDIAAGTNDGCVYLFTQEASRQAPQAAIESFEANVASQALPSNQVGDINKDNLPDASALQQPGRKEGEVKMVRVGSVVEAHQWDSSSGQWVKIGEVVDAVGQGRKQLHNGQEYDYVFDINIEDGKPNLKLPYNVTENPYSAAMNFIQKNQLPVAYIDQVADFITKNTKGETLGSTNSTNQSQYVDPYTGGSRYVAQSAQSAPTNIPSANASHPFPICEILTFKQANTDAILTKLKQLNESVNQELRIEASRFQDIDALSKSSGDASLPGLAPLLSIITTWPASQRFPALDLLRVLTLTVPWYVDNSLISTAELGADISSLSPNTPLSKEHDILIMLACRMLANATAVAPANIIVKSSDSLTEWISTVGNYIPETSPNTRIAYFSLLVNLSSLSIKQPSEYSFPDDSYTQWTLSSMTALVQIVNSKNPITSVAPHSEGLYRALVVIGNLFSSRPDGRDLATITELPSALQNLSSSSNLDPKVSTLAKQIMQAFLS